MLRGSLLHRGVSTYLGPMGVKIPVPIDSNAVAIGNDGPGFPPKTVVGVRILVSVGINHGEHIPV